MNSSKPQFIQVLNNFIRVPTCNSCNGLTRRGSDYLSVSYDNTPKQLQYSLIRLHGEDESVEDCRTVISFPLVLLTAHFDGTRL